MLATKFDTEWRRARGFAAFLRDERGASAIEYALIAAGISVVISAAVLAIGSTLQNNYYQPLAEKLSGD
jgi:pilus assembly protein Flp/PilA